MSDCVEDRSIMLNGSVERIEFRSGGQRVIGLLHLTDRRLAASNRIVITSHGLMSSKDSDKYLQIADRFTSQGISVLRFDFRGSGESEGSGNLLTNRIEDLRSAVRFVEDRGFKSIGVLGSSYGGATAILVSSKTPKLRALVTWSTPCQLVKLFKSIDGLEPRSSALDTKKSDKKVVETSEFIKDLSKHDVIEAATKVCRILVVHCKEDQVVPWTQAKIIHENAKQPKRLEVFEGGDHQLLDPSIRKRAIELSLKWFNQFL